MKFFSLIFVLSAATAFASPPTRVESFGPNGSHWPNPGDKPPTSWNRNLPESLETPFPGDVVKNSFEVACDWEEIKKTLSDLTPRQVADGVIVRVRPGTLRGVAGTRVLADVGDAAHWPQRVTVCPRDGFGTVVWEGQVEMARVERVAFVGFITQNLKFENCGQSALIWSWVSARNSYTALFSSSGYSFRDFEFVEVVFGDGAAVATSDRLFIASGGPRGGVERVRLDGCFFFPKYRARGSSLHIDQIQLGLSGSKSGADFYPHSLYLRDNYIFGTHTATFQRFDRTHLEHNLIVGGEKAVRLGLGPPDGSQGKVSRAWIQGYARGNVAIDNWIVDLRQDVSKNTGSSSAHPEGEWRHILGNRANDDKAFRLAVEDGAWKRDSKVRDEILPKVPTRESMGELWNWNGVGRVRKEAARDEPRKAGD